MLSLKQISYAFVLVWIVFPTAAAQEGASTAALKTSLTITANASGDRIRVAAPSSVVQIHLEVYAATGEKLFDEELRGANVFDWHLQNGQAQRLPAGDYVCVVTAKTISGRLTQKIGAVTVAENSSALRPGDSQQFTPPQAQAIGPVEADSSWTIVADGENKTTTVIANTGTEGQMIRGRGALTFRIGDFFRGKDEEQMRLSEEGNLGIGTSTPQSKLDVAGTVRAERFLVVRPSTAAGKAQSNGATQAADDAGSVQPLASGTGTLNQIAKWLETGGSGTLGDSGITETAGGNVGIGTTSPGDKLTVNGNLGVGSNRIYNGASNNSAGIDFITPGLVNVSGFSGIAFNSSTTTLGSQTERMRISNNGNVGIATSSPTDTLSVNGNIGLGQHKIYNGAGNNSAGIDFITPGLLNLSGFSGITFNSSAAGLGSQTERLRITNNGNVGIGTKSPDLLLDVADRMRVRQGANAANTAGVWFYQNTPATDQAFVGMLDDTHVGFYGAGTGWGLIMNTNNGNIGFGTNTPSYPLSVVGSSGAGANQGVVEYTSSGNDTGVRLRNQASNGRTWTLFSSGGSSGIGAGNFNIFDATSAQSRLTVDPSGNVGIGTISPGFRLDVADRMRLRQGGSTSAGLWFFQNGPGTDQAFVGMQDDTHVGFFGNNGAGWGFTMDTTNGNLTTNGSLSNSAGTAVDAANLNNGTITPGLTFGGGGSGEGISSKRTTGGNQFGLDFFTNFTSRMSITNGGNVGIGTAFPSNGKFDVEATTTGPLGVPVAVYANGDTTNGFGIYGSGGFGTNSVGVRGESYRGVGVVAQTVIGNLVEGINGSSRVFHIDYNGTYTAGSDFAEALPASANRAGYEPGDVLVISTKAPGKIEKASQSYDPRLAGIYSTRPGMLGADKNGTSQVNKDDVPVAIVGIVPTKVSAMNGPIQVGDLLTTSSIPGYAMKASPVLVRGVKVYRTGTILGKALEPLQQGKGMIKVLVTLR